MPVLLCRDKGVLNWLLSDAYCGREGNMVKRHAASARSQLYVLVGSRASDLINSLSKDIEVGNAAFVLLENWGNAGSSTEGLHALLNSHGGTRVVHSEPGRAEESVHGTWSPKLYVLEGS